MKLKFRADPKDWLIFILFSLFLSYFISIAVGNIVGLVRGTESISCFIRRFIPINNGYLSSNAYLGIY